MGTYINRGNSGFTGYTNGEYIDKTGMKPELMDSYVNLLRRLFKGGNTARVFAGVYMTGILPIKKLSQCQEKNH